jgi:hypothetical protein
MTEQGSSYTKLIAAMRRVAAAKGEQWIYSGTVLPGPPLNRPMGTRHLLSFLEHQFEHGRCGVGPHCCLCGTFTGPFSEIEGLVTVSICIPCLEVRLAQPDTLLGLHDPGQPWERWGCPIDGCGRWFIGPWYLEWHTAAEHPGWTATYELLRPYPNQRQRVVYRRSHRPPAS